MTRPLCYPDRKKSSVTYPAWPISGGMFLWICVGLAVCTLTMTLSLRHGQNCPFVKAIVQKKAQETAFFNPPADERMFSGKKTGCLPVVASGTAAHDIVLPPVMFSALSSAVPASALPRIYQRAPPVMRG